MGGRVGVVNRRLASLPAPTAGARVLGGSGFVVVGRWTTVLVGGRLGRVVAD